MALADALRRDRIGNQLIARTLKDGDLATGADEKAVRYLERMLKLAGFNPGTQDRHFDAKTARALKAFQAARGLPATGVLDAKTFEHLKAILKRVRNHRKAPFFGRGQKDKMILVAEKRLRRLGYDTGKVDGIFDRRTQKALAGFKKDEGMKGGAFVTERSAKALRQEVAGFSHHSYRARVRKDLAAHKRLDAATARAAERTKTIPVLNPDGTPKLDAEGNPVTKQLRGLGLGDTGRAVKNLQWHLELAGFDVGRRDGVFDGRTLKALQAFQRRLGAKKIGERVGPNLWKRLQRTAIYAKGDATPAQRLWERSRAVKRTEKVLKTLGLNPGKVDGVFDKKTAAAVRRFEKQKGLKQNGVVSARNLKAMKKAAQGVTARELTRIMPNLSLKEAQSYVPHLNKAMAEFKINTRKRRAMFLAQIAHETGGFRWFTELSSGWQYEGRSDLGNTHPGDGPRYKGRGAIQLTGRYNYRNAGRALGLPLEARPKMAARKSVSFRIAGWYWKSRNLNYYADRGDLRGVTLRINGGYNGLAERGAYYRRALKALG